MELTILILISVTVLACVVAFLIGSQEGEYAANQKERQYKNDK